MTIRSWILPFVLPNLLASSSVARPQPRTDPLPQGQRIVAQDGDVILVEGDDRVSVVQRRQAIVRVVFDANRKIVLVLADTASRTRSLDGLVDWTWRFHVTNVQGPIEPRWEGPAVVEQGMPGTGVPSSGLVIETAEGNLIFGGLSPARSGTPTPRTVITSDRSGGGPLRGQTFDEAERLQIADADRGPGYRVDIPDPGSRFEATLQGRLDTGVPAGTRPQATGAVRVGGNIPPPTKVRDARPIYPADALAARIQGNVILELRIGPDGAVQDAKVLRGIQLLDDAALAAVRQ